MSLLSISPECKEREIRFLEKRKSVLEQRARNAMLIMEKRLEQIKLVDEEIKTLRGEGDL